MDSALNESSNFPVLDLLNEEFHSAGLSSFSKHLKMIYLKYLVKLLMMTVFQERKTLI